MKEKKVLQKNEKLSRNQAQQQKSHQENNTREALLVRYLDDSNNDKGRDQIDQKTRKLITIYKALNPRDDKEYIHKKGGKGLARIENCVDASKQKLEDYIKNARETSL